MKLKKYPEITNALYQYIIDHSKSVSKANNLYCCMMQFSSKEDLVRRIQARIDGHARIPDVLEHIHTLNNQEEIMRAYKKKLLSYEILHQKSAYDNSGLFIKMCHSIFMLMYSILSRYLYKNNKKFAEAKKYKLWKK